MFGDWVFVFGDDVDARETELMAGVQILDIPEDADGSRLDRFLRKTFAQLSQGQIEKMCRKGELRLDGGRVKANARLEAGQKLRVPPLPDQPAPARVKSKVSDKDAAMIEGAVIYRDADLILLNKPSGLAVQGGSKTERHVDGLAEALKFGRENKPMLVHRLDKDTSGLLVLARHAKAAQAMAKLFQSKAMEKVYWALVAGVPNPREGRINLGLVKAAGHGAGGEGEKMRVVAPDEVERVKGAKNAVTDFMVMDVAGSRMSWLAMSPLTGRTHQLRAHAAGIGHPIIGDGKYGGSSAENRGDGWGAGVGGDIERRLHLHARSLRFEHPMNGRRVFFTAPLPQHMKKSWDMFGWGESRDEDEKWIEARENLR